MAVQDNIDNSGDCCDHNHYQIHYLKPATKEQLPRGKRREREREEEEERGEEKGEERRMGRVGRKGTERGEKGEGRRRSEGLQARGGHSNMHFT